MEREALLVAGPDGHSTEEAMEFARYLVIEAGVNKQELRIVQCNTSEGLTDSVSEFRNNLDSRANAIVAYFGHGYNGGIPLCDCRFPYDELADILRFERPFIFINTSCHSGSAVPYFNPNRGLVLTSASRKEIAVGNHFVQRLLDTYRKQRRFKLRKIKLKGLQRQYIEVHSPDGKLVGTAKVLEGNCYEKKWFCDNQKSGVYEHKIWVDNNHTHIQHPQRRGLSLDALLYKSK
jgi:hypothetical protein